MSSYKTDQRRVVHRGREFHFVSYEGVAANPRLGNVATPASWFLMSAGKRWMVMPQTPDQAGPDFDLELHSWLDAHVFLGGPAVLQPRPPARFDRPVRRGGGGG